jgi:hypothetical protein
MTKLSILTLADREPIMAGDTRYLLGDFTGKGYETGQYVIIVEPRTPDDLTAPSSEEAYGTLAVITEDGLQVVSTMGLGVLVLPTE